MPKQTICLIGSEDIYRKAIEAVRNVQRQKLRLVRSYVELYWPYTSKPPSALSTRIAQDREAHGAESFEE